MLATYRILRYRIDKCDEVLPSVYITPFRVLEEGDVFFDKLDKISKLLDAKIDERLESIDYLTHPEDPALTAYKKVRSCVLDVKEGSVKCEEINKDVLSGISNLIQDNFIRCEAVFDFDPKESVGYVFEGSKSDRYAPFKAKRSAYSDIDLKYKILCTICTIESLVMQDGLTLKNLELLDEVGDFNNLIKFADINNITRFNAKRSKQDDFYKFVKFVQIYKLIKVLLDAHSKELTIDEFYNNILFVFDNHRNITKFKTEIRKVFHELNYL